jgi:hypothetical protein
VTGVVDSLLLVGGELVQLPGEDGVLRLAQVLTAPRLSSENKNFFFSSLFYMKSSHANAILGS